MIKEVYDNLPKVSDVYINTLELIEGIKSNQLYPHISDHNTRVKAKYFDLEDEKFFEILNRIEKDGDEYMDLPEVFTYFTRRGKPCKECFIVEDTN